MLIRATPGTILAQYLKPFLLIRLHTLVFAKDHNSSVFYHLRTLESKTPGGGIPSALILPALRVRLPFLHFYTR